MVRHPFAPVRDAVHRVTEPARGRREARAARSASEPPRSDLAPRATDDREEELAAMRAAEERLGDDADEADRATRTANAYLAARRRRLRRQLEHAER